MKVLNQASIQQYIDNEIQESLELDYKGADSLDKSDMKKREITKDVSAMANSSGGRIIYGIKEYDAKDQRHLPERIDPIAQDKFTKEWLEQVINNIRPRIIGITIQPIQLDSAPGHVVYVVDIPQSITAHQALDKRYYKRFNFESVPMEDYEIRDTMGRKQHPNIDLSFVIEIAIKRAKEGDYIGYERTRCTLKITARNTGGVYAQFVNGFLMVPVQLLPETEIKNVYRYHPQGIIENDGQKYFSYAKDNTVQDVLGFEHDVSTPLSTNPIPRYGPSRYAPILPGLYRTWEIELGLGFEAASLEGLVIKWSTYADSAPVTKGEILVADIEVVRHMKK